MHFKSCKGLKFFVNIVNNYIWYKKCHEKSIFSVERLTSLKDACLFWTGPILTYGKHAIPVTQKSTVQTFVNGQQKCNIAISLLDVKVFVHFFSFEVKELIELP